jgi:hypothetical protein
MGLIVSWDYDPLSTGGTPFDLKATSGAGLWDIDRRRGGDLGIRYVEMGFVCAEGL